MNTETQSHHHFFQLQNNFIQLYLPPKLRHLSNKIKENKVKFLFFQKKNLFYHFLPLCNKLRLFKLQLFDTFADLSDRF